MSTSIDQGRTHERDVVELTKELIRIRSENPPGDQRSIGDFLESKMKEIGLNVEKYDYEENKPNVLGRLVGEKEKPVLMLNGHVDTVPVRDAAEWRFAPFEPTESEGKLYGRGAADMKGGLAAMICAAERIIETGPKLRGSLLVACVVDEEITGYGTKDILEKGYTADFAVVCEPNELQVQTAHKGALEFEVLTHGRAAHSSRPRQGINAIYKMSKVCLALEDYLSELEKVKHPLVGNATISVGIIEGGYKRNVVPDACRMQAERRVLPGEQWDQVKGDLEKIFQKLRDEDQDLSLQWKVLLECDASETPACSPIVQESVKAVSKVTGKEIEPTGFGATCDMRFLVNQGRIPTVILGPGSVAQAHVENEYIETQQLVDATEIYYQVSLKLLR